MSEALEVDHEDGGGFVNLHLFLGTHMLFAFVAVPLVVLIQNFRLTELIETVFDGNIRLRLLFLIFFFILRVNSFSQFHS
jgi:hypothetical protein